MATFSTCCGAYKYNIKCSRASCDYDQPPWIFLAIIMCSAVSMILDGGWGRGGGSGQIHLVMHRTNLIHDEIPILAVL